MRERGEMLELYKVIYGGPVADWTENDHTLKDLLRLFKFFLNMKAIVIIHTNYFNVL